MSLGGWSRLGVVISVLFGSFIFITSYESRPTLRKLQSDWFYDVADIVVRSAAIDGVTTDRYRVVTKMQANMSNEEIVQWAEKYATSPTEKQMRASADMAKVNAKHKAIIEQLPKQILKYWLLQLAIWFGGTCLLFSSAWAVRWIYRGFRARDT